LLSALLESMVLCFADVPLNENEASGAYRELISLGMSDDLASESFELNGSCQHFLITGKHQRPVVDEAEAQKMAASTAQERTRKMADYLMANIYRYGKVSVKPLESIPWREQLGNVVPEDTLSLELMRDLKKSYERVLGAIEVHLAGGFNL